MTCSRSRGRRWPSSRRGIALRVVVTALAVVMSLLHYSTVRAEIIDLGDLSTPRRAAWNFIDAADRGDWDRARKVLEGGTANSSEAKERTLELARQLDYLLSRSITFDLDKIADTPAGKPDDGVDTEQVASLYVHGEPMPIVMRRLQTQPPRWVFSAATLVKVPDMYAARGPRQFEAKLPQGLRQPLLGMQRWQWLGLGVSVVASLLAGQFIAFFVFRLAAAIATRTRIRWDDELVGALHAPGRLLITVIVFVPLGFLLNLPGTMRLICIRMCTTLALAAVAWSAIRIAGVISNWVERRAVEAAAGEHSVPAVRGVQTRVRVLRRVVTLVLLFCAGAIMLMQFEFVRQIGVSLLASAGVAGVVLGFAAQRTLGSLFAGIQLSITQPIRIGDEVIVENEFGTIEEITLTYVVVKIWDERRLIVPMTRFLEQPFQNWTKISSQLHGSVMLYADWGLPVGALRTELDRLLANHPLWDGRTKLVQVTDAREHTLEIRILVSAANGGDLFNLRADLRERLVAWLSRCDSGRYLPRARIEGQPRFSEN